MPFTAGTRTTKASHVDLFEVFKVRNACSVYLNKN